MAHSQAHEPTHYSLSATAYAQSLLDLANQQNQAEAIGQEIQQLKKVLDENPTFVEILANPAIGVEAREQTIERIFKNNVSPLVYNTIGVMNQYGRLKLLREVAGAYLDLLDEQLGKIEVDLTVAQRLTPEQIETAKAKIGAALKREVVVHQYVNESIIGGVVVRVGDKLIDASVKYQLASIKEQLLAARPK